MKKILAVVLMLFMASVMFAEKAAVFPELKVPKKITVNGDKLYISEKGTISVYSLKDFKRIVQFGRLGEGPQEFMLRPAEGFARITMNVGKDDDYIYVNSMAKFSVFKKDGTFVRSNRILDTILELQPLDKGKYLGWRSAFDKGYSWWMVSIYDDKFEKVKEVFRIKNTYQPGEGLKLLSKTLSFETFDKKILVSGFTDLRFDIYDANGKLIRSVKKECKRIKVTEDDKKEWRQWLKLTYKQIYERLRNSLHFPEFYPAIRIIKVSDTRIYVLSYVEKDGKNECYVFDKEGKYLKKIFLPVKRIDIRSSFPYTINHGKLYQLIDNDETNEWELHITDIK